MTATKLKIHVTPKNAVYGGRLWLEKSPDKIMDEKLRATLDVLSSWGGPDKYGDNYQAWEFPTEVRSQAAIEVLQYRGYEVVTDTAWMKHHQL